jgi:putative ABC transport system permease protein
MRWLPDRYGGLRRLVRGGHVEREVDEEFAFHLDSVVAELTARGARPEAARAEALRRFGRVDTLREETVVVDREIEREAGRAEFLYALGRELRLAFRSLRRSPGFTLAALLTLGLGIGATTAIYTLLDAVVLRPLPYAESDRLVQIGSEVPGMGVGSRWGLSVAGYFHFQEHGRTLESLAYAAAGETTLTGGFAAERVNSASVSAGIFDVLRVAPAQGRAFRVEEERPGSERVAILGWDFWQQRYGGADVLGRTITLAGLDREIVGIMPRDVHLPQARVDVWLPVAFLDPTAPPVNSHWVSAIGRLQSGVAPDEAQRELAALTAQFPELFPGAYPQSFMERYGFDTYVSALQEEIVGTMARTLWVLLLAVAIVFLVAAANVANLFLVRIESRRRELAVRRALGAGRRALATHFLGESALIGGGSVVLAVFFAWLGTRLLVSIAPPHFPRLDEVGLTPGAVLAAILVGLLTMVVFGLVPLLQSTETALLREGRSTTAARRRRGIRSTLVVSQTALALVLLAAAGLALESFRQLTRVDIGIRPENALTFQVALPAMSYQGFQPVLEFYRSLTQRIEELNGVAAVGVTNMLPPVAGTGCSVVFIEDRPLQPGEEPRCVPTVTGSPGVYEALGVRVDGEVPSWAAMEHRAAGVVVTRAFAERFWPGEDPIGKGVRGNGAVPPYYRVVAVTGDIRAHGVDQPPAEAVFFPLQAIDGAPLWSPMYTGNVVVRTAAVPPLALIPQLRAVLAELNPEVPLVNPRTLHHVVENSPSMARASFTLTLLLIAGLMGLLLSAVGVFGVISYTVAQRTGEIGIRLALGARIETVKALVLRQSLTTVLIGVALGLVASVAGLRIMQSLLYEVSPTDPRVLFGVVAVLLAVAVLASYLPARRAAKVDPASVLRAE